MFEGGELAKPPPHGPGTHGAGTAGLRGSAATGGGRGRLFLYRRAKGQTRGTIGETRRQGKKDGRVGRPAKDRRFQSPSSSSSSSSSSGTTSSMVASNSSIGTGLGKYPRMP